MEKSYTSKIVLKTNGNERELKLGGNNYMFTELDDYLFGDFSRQAFTDYGVLINSGKFNGLKSEQAIQKITAWLTNKQLGKRAVNYINEADIKSEIRIFTIECQELSKNIEINSNFEY